MENTSVENNKKKEVKKFGSKVKEGNTSLLFEVLQEVKTKNMEVLPMSKKIEFDGREFNSTEELLSYMNELKEVMVRQECKIKELEQDKEVKTRGRKPAEISKEVVYYIKDVLFRELLLDAEKVKEYVKRGEAALHISELKRAALGVTRLGTGKGFVFPKGQNTTTIKPTKEEIEKYLTLDKPKDEIKYEDVK